MDNPWHDDDLEDMPDFPFELDCWGRIKGPAVRKRTFSEWSTDHGPHQTDSRTAQLYTDPHYSNPKYDHPQTIFGRQQTGPDPIVSYTDRLYQADYKARALETETPRTANFFERYLALYHNQAVDLFWMMAGVNVSSGYPYLIFGYRFKRVE
jgi:hypothetical protein